MKKAIRLSSWLVIMLFASALLAGAASIDKILTYRGVGDVEVSPDGARAVFVATVADLEENVMNSDLWVVDLATGRSFQLTRSPKRDNAPAWSPDGRRLGFLSDRSGKVNIWLISPDGGEAEPATKFEKMAVSSFEWLPDGSGFIFTAVDPATPEEEKRKKEKEDAFVVDQDFKFARLYRWKFGDKEPAKLTPEDSHVTSFNVSPDGRWVAYSVQPTPKVPDFRKSDLKLLDLQSGERKDLVTRPGLDAAPRFSPDGQWIAFVSSSGHEDWTGNSNLWVVRPDGTGLRNLSAAFDESIGAFGGGGHRWSPDAQWIYFLAGQGVAQRLFRINVASTKFEPVSDNDRQRACNSFDLGPKAAFVVVTVSDPATPAEAYRLPLPAGALQKLSEVNADFAGTAPTTELLRYRSPDGLNLEGLVIKPKNFEPGKRYPLLVVVHGGPAGVFDFSFTPRRGAYPLHAFTDQGYVLFLPNPRGSGSYGERFRQANLKDWGYGDYRDIMQGVDLLIQQGVADPAHLGVMGWSYGGYMTSWIVSQTDRFQAASMGAGLSDLISMYGLTDIPEFSEAYFGAKPWEDPQLYLHHSAINFVARAKTPTLIQHGQEDRRVPIAQGEEYYRALRNVGVPAEMVVYPRQPHGFTEPRLIKDSMERNLNWFNKWILGLEPPKKKEEKKEEKPAE